MNPHYLYFIASGSGGHIVPCLTVAQEYQQRFPDAQLILITSDRALDSAIISNYPWIKQIKRIHVSKFPGLKWWKYPAFFLNLLEQFVRAFKIIKKNGLVISFGGSLSISFCFAAWCKRNMIELFELNAIPGKAIRLTSYLAQRIYICFQEAQPYLPADKCILRSYPIRFKQKNLIQKKNALHKTILILGGSQGSLFINTIMKQFIENNQAMMQQFNIIHQTGSAHMDDLKNFYQQHALQATVFDYQDNLDYYYALADLIICRSGAGTLFEALFFQKKCITIPLESCADNHQVANATALAHRYPHLITVLQQTDLKKDPELFKYAFLIHLLADGHESGLLPNPYT